MNKTCPGGTQAEPQEGKKYAEAGHVERGRQPRKLPDELAEELLHERIGLR